MGATLVLNPKFSTPFLGQKLSSQRSTKDASRCGLNYKPPKCAIHSSEGGNVPKFTRMNTWNPYKHLGVSNHASEEEIWGSRNFLLQQYAGHERSVESIEAAFEKLLVQSFKARKATKMNLKSRLKKKVEESPPWLQSFVTNTVDLPPLPIILRRLFLFSVITGWSIMNSAESGPAFQVAVALAASVYFLFDKSKNVGRGLAVGCLLRHCVAANAMGVSNERRNCGWYVYIVLRHVD
ncbi:CHAPERONE-LIKE PROTEIN [Drosera capensis]